MSALLYLLIGMLNGISIGYVLGSSKNSKKKKKIEEKKVKRLIEEKDKRLEERKIESEELKSSIIGVITSKE